jgi:hypothetical protein
MKHIRNLTQFRPPIVMTVVVGIALLIASSYLFYQSRVLSSAVAKASKEKEEATTRMRTLNQELEKLKHEDQYVRNETLQKEIKNIETTYKNTVTAYEKLLALKDQTDKTEEYDTQFADILSMLSQRNYTSASASLVALNNAIQKKQTEIASTFSIPKNVATSNTPPASGASRQSVKIDSGIFLVDIIAADLNSTRVIVDTASDSDCRNDCPVMPLGDYAARSGAFAGINGPYFCPADYPSCADKKNSFDTLLMNKNKTYFNSSNNVYSTVPAVIFSGNSARFVGQSLEWGRDTGVDAVIASQPMLVSNGESTFGGDDVAKRSSKGSRSFIGATDSTVYIGVVHNATTAEVAQVLKTLGVRNALNLDSGGTTALWSGNYLVGPGRNSPYGILFVRK